MLDPTSLKPITGTFIAPFINDTGTNNWGKDEWEADFRLMKSLGMDTVVVLHAEFEYGGHRESACDPRNTTWPEDDNLLEMIFRLCDEHEMTLYLGGTEPCSLLYAGKWQEVIEENREFYERALDKWGHHPCWQGIYCSNEALPWHFNYFEVVEGILDVARELAPQMKTLHSPTFNGIRGDRASRYSPAEFGDMYGRLFDRLGGKLDAAAWQDKFFHVDARGGTMLPNVLDEWYEAAQDFSSRNGIELWANIESFQRQDERPGERPTAFRQGDYRTLITKLQSAAKYVDKLITFEFCTCLDPNAEWGSSGRLLQRYVEAVGLDPDTIAWP